jgi:hypothetical protein
VVNAIKQDARTKSIGDNRTKKLMGTKNSARIKLSVPLLAITASKHKRRDEEGLRLKLLPASQTFIYFASAQKHLYL